jgi:UDPglucose--hexose-1-phosphate uridylyltransferase
LCLAPDERFGALPEASDAARDGFAAMLVDVLARLDRLHDAALPYMLWMYQEPTGWDGPPVWFHCEIVSPWRAKGVPRYIAAAETACDEYVNPVAPEDLAGALRALAGGSR